MQRRLLVAVFSVLQAAVLVLGIVDSLIWLPEATAPTTPLDRVYAALGASDDLVASIASPVIWLGFWALIGALFVATQLPVRTALRSVVLRPLAATSVALLVLGGTGFLHWWSAFAMGMSVSDELPPGCGTTTSLGVTIVVGGLLCLALGAVLGVVSLATRPEAAAALS